MKQCPFKTFVRIIGACAIVMIIAMSETLQAQVGIDVPSPDPSTVLDLNVASKDRGLLVPKVSSADRENIASPADGLLVFDETLKTFYFWNGSSSKWQAINPFTYRKGSNAVDEDNFVITLTNNKSVVIGTVASPSSKLEVGGDIRASNNISAATMTTSGDMTANGKFVGYGTIPLGGIIMWSGNSSTIPDGWALCDGQTYDGYETPNLTGRFVVSYKPGDAAYGEPGNYSTGVTPKVPGNTGGLETVTLTIAQMPSHDHNISHGHGITDPGHAHTNQLSDSGGEGHADDAGGGVESTADTDAATTGITVNNFNGNSGATGGGAAHENRPPYYVLAFIIRIR